MNQSSLIALSLFLVACSGETFTSIPGAPMEGGAEGSALEGSAESAASEAGEDAGADASSDGPCTKENGKNACDAVLLAYCQRLVQCQGGTVQNCIAGCASQGVNCSDSKYAVRTVCTASKDACVGFMNESACGNINSCGTVGKACGDFWGQF